MTITEFIALVVAIGAAIKSLDWIAGLVKAWNDRRKENKQSLNQADLDRRKLEHLAQTDFVNIDRENLNAIKNAAIELMQTANARADAAVKRADAAEKSLDEFRIQFKDFTNKFNDEFEQMKEDCKKNETVRIQLEQGIRMLCDTFKIAYWAVTPDGHLEGNHTFFTVLTGLTAAECHNDGWFEAIDEAERETVKEYWKEFLLRSETKPSFKFTFVHKHTRKQVKTKVFCLPVMLDGLTVYKFTAQTAPLNIN